MEQVLFPTPVKVAAASPFFKLIHGTTGPVVVMLHWKYLSNDVIYTESIWTVKLNLDMALFYISPVH